MAKIKKSHPNLLLLIIILVESVLLFWVLFTKYSTPAQHSTTTSQSETMHPKIMQQLKEGATNVTWNDPVVAIETTSYGELSGSKVTGTTTTSSPTYPHFENISCREETT